MRKTAMPKGTPFQKGRSGNPGGRPKIAADVRALAQSHAPAAIEELARLMLQAERDETRLKAIELLLDRGYGRPVQAVEAAPAEQEVVNVVRVPLPAQSVEQWQAEADAWRASQATFGRAEVEQFMQTGRPIVRPGKPN